jgi:hypothetical protein
MKTRILGLLSAALLLVALIGASATNAADFVSPSGKKHLQLGLGCASCHAVSKPSVAAPASACVKCHANSGDRYVGLGAKKYVGDGGAIKTVNPHQTHLVELPCTDCHKTHAASVIYCNECHAFKDMPAK